MTSWSAVVGAARPAGRVAVLASARSAGSTGWTFLRGRSGASNPDAGEVESWAMPMEPGCIAPHAQRRPGHRPARRHLPARNWGGPLSRSPASATTSRPPASTTARPIRWGASGPAPCTSRATRARPSCTPSTCASAGGKPLIELKAHNAIIANGLAWSPDASTLYWADTANHVIHAWDWDAAEQRDEPSSRVPAVPGQARRLEARRAGLWRPAGRRRGGRRGQLLVGDVRRPAAAQVLAGRPVAGRSSRCRCAARPCPASAATTSGRCMSPARSYNRPAEELQALPLSGCVIATRVDVPGLPVNFVSD